MVITNFKLFCEARLADLVKIKGEGDLAKNLKGEQMKTWRYIETRFYTKLLFISGI